MIVFNNFNSDSCYIDIDIDFKINQIIITTEEDDYNDDFSTYNAYLDIDFTVNNKKYSIDYKFIGSGGYYEIKVFDDYFNELNCDFLVDIILQNEEVSYYYNEFENICSKLN